MDLIADLGFLAMGLALWLANFPFVLWLASQIGALEAGLAQMTEPQSAMGVPRTLPRVES
jgi:hypothetical protein